MLAGCGNWKTSCNDDACLLWSMIASLCEIIIISVLSIILYNNTHKTLYIMRHDATKTASLSHFVSHVLLPSLNRTWTGHTSPDGRVGYCPELETMFGDVDIANWARSKIISGGCVTTNHHKPKPHCWSSLLPEKDVGGATLPEALPHKKDIYILSWHNGVPWIFF